LIDAGVDRAVFTMPPLGPETVIPRLDEHVSELESMGLT
jgi:hypothetical protein